MTPPEDINNFAPDMAVQPVAREDTPPMPIPDDVRRIDPRRPDLSEYAIHTRHWGMAARVGEQHFGRLLFVIGLGWHVWDGKRWVLDPNEVQAGRLVGATLRHAWGEVSRLDPDARKALIRDIQLCETSSGTAGVLHLARSIPGMSVPLDQVDADPWLLNTATGTLDLRTFKIRDPDPADFITKVTTGGYHPTSPAAAPRWNAFLERIQPDPEIRAYIARLYGYGLLGLVREHVMPIFTGEGRNGKSTLIEAAGFAMGDYYASVKPEMLIATGNGRPGSTATPDIMQLMGRRVVSMVETNSGDRLDTPRVKNLTGGDTITARPLYRDVVTFKPSHLPIMVTNHLPEVPADDPALWARLAVVPFDVRIPDSERDESLGEALQLESYGILAWAIAGLVDYSARRRLDPPIAVSTRTKQYQDDSDLVALWIADCCTRDPFNTYITASRPALWESWQVWARNTRRPTGRQVELFAALLALEGTEEKRSNTSRLITGIALNG